MNKYISRKEKRKQKKAKYNTDPINVDRKEFEYEPIKFDDLTYKESMSSEIEVEENNQHEQENNNVNENNSSSVHSSYTIKERKDGEIDMDRSVFSTSNSSLNNQSKAQHDFSNFASKYDNLKLLKLKQKIVDDSVSSNGFFTNIINNYNILDFFVIFSVNNNTNLGEVIKKLIINPTPITIKSLEKNNFNSSEKRLFGLMQTSKADYGSSALKIGWPFVAGKITNFKDETKEFVETQQSNQLNTNLNNLEKPLNEKYLYAPLLLWPVILQTRDREIFNMHLTRKHGQLVVEVNSHLLLSITHTNGFFDQDDNINIKTDAFVKVLYNPDHNVFINNVVEKYMSFGYKFSNEAINELKRIFENYEIKKMVPISNDENVKKEIEQLCGNLNDNEFKVFPFASVGIYPLANVSLYIDYIKMLRTDGIGFVNRIDNTFYSQLKLAEEYHKYFSETKLKEIVKLDFSQKKACNVALSDSLVISGAAGNGKSQTISSIIANAVNNLKSVLFSTEKKEAANVIFNRLGRLRNYSLKLFESDNFAKDFTSQLKNGLERISLVYGIQDSISSSNVNIVSEKLDTIYKRVKDFKSIMTSDEGQNYPEYIFKKNQLKQTLKEVIRLVGPIIKHSESSSDFWIKINSTVDDYNEFMQISKVKENLNLEDDLFVQVFNIIKYFDGNDIFYDNYLIQYSRTKKVNEAFEQLPEEKVKEFLANREQVHLGNYATDPKALYWSLYTLFQSLDDYSVDILKSHDIHWYAKTSNMIKQKSTELIIEFREKYSPDEFDYEFFKDYYSMEKFAADNGDSFQVDNEKYYELIDTLITNKLGEDIRNTEFLFALTVTKILKENENLAESFNKLYSLVKNQEVVNSVGDILVNYSKVISLIFPLILGSPSMIAKYVICESGIFDICIIDEASMIPLENAFPLLYRSNRWIISGDMKQLPPASYQKNIKEYNKYRLMQVNNSIKTVESENLMKFKVFETPISLLEYIGTKIQTVVLEYHYRSVKKELFEFSNVVFYRNMIHVADDQNEQQEGVVTGINLKTTEGFCENGVNIKEAQEVVKIVEQIVQQPNHGTIGIITTTNEQRDYIENLLLEHPSKLVTNEFSRISDDGEDNSMFVLTCEKVQGSERDNIIISFVASKDKNNKANFLSVNRTLGILGSEVGPNFLNVLITRSRLALYIVNSFEIDEIIIDNNPSLAILRDYIEYATLLTSNGHNLNDPKVQAIFKPYIKNNAMIDFSNDMKGRAISQVAPDLKEDLQQLFAFEPRLEVVNGWYEGSVKIDLVIKDKLTGRNIIGILCDEFIYDVMVNGKQRDYYNRKFLETRNWKFFALSSLQWSKIYKRRSIIDQIVNMLTINLSSWVDPLRITKLNKYSTDENGNVVINESLIKKSSNRLEVIEIEEPVVYEVDKLILQNNLVNNSKKDVVNSKASKSKKEKNSNKKSSLNKTTKIKAKTASKPKAKKAKAKRKK